MFQEDEQNFSYEQEFQSKSEEPPVSEPQVSWDYEEVYDEKPKKNKTTGRIIALALCCSLVGGILGAAGVYFTANRFSSEITPSLNEAQDDTAHMLEGIREDVTIDITTTETGTLLSAAEVYAKNVNSTVGITTSVTTNFWGYQTTSAASGSGFILSENGYILTNHHVIESSDSITVSLYDGTSYDAKLVGYDASNDIAVLKVEAQGLAPVILGDSEKMHVGDSVLAIGNPLGELTFSLTSGAISAMDRLVTMSNGVTMNLMQTDCAINSGNSGGALFNLYGEVIGITNAKYSTSSASEASIDNIGFAIPINDVRNIITSIIEKGYIAKPYIGVSVTDVSADAQRYGLPKGAAIASVAEGSPAEAAGLIPNDIITHVNGTPITGSNDLITAVGKMQVGEALVLTVYRQGASSEITLSVGEQIQSATEESENASTQISPAFPWGAGGFGW